MTRIVACILICGLAIGYHLWAVAAIQAGQKDAITEASRSARDKALAECAAQHSAATELIKSNARVTQIVMNGVAASQLAAAELAKGDAQRLADSFARQLAKQREAKPLPSPCNVTAERADYLNRLSGAQP